MLKNRLYLLTVYLMFCMPVFSQTSSAKRLFAEGQKAYYNDKYDIAIKKLTEAIEEMDGEYNIAVDYLGRSYYFDKQFDKAIETFSELDYIDSLYNAYYCYLWGRAYVIKSRLPEGAEALRKFLRRYTDGQDNIHDRHKGKYLLNYCLKSVELRKQDLTMPPPVNLGPEVNSEQEEYQPVVNPTGKILYFTSKKKGGFDDPDGSDKTGWGSDIYKVEKTASGWGEPELLPEPINSYNNEGTASFSGDGQIMVYTICNRDDGVGECDIYISTLEGDKWTEPKNMGDIVNCPEWDSHPALSADGNTLIFVSIRDGGYGATDLYITRKNKFGDWGLPVNLGDVINTPFSEYSPYLSPDGKTLYFGSNGHPGYGDQDIFMSVFENNKWSEPVNLGAPLNSEKEDQFFTIGGSGEVGYFSSDREGTYGKTDLYSIEIPEDMRPQPTIVLTGVVSDSETNEPLNTDINIENSTSGVKTGICKSNSGTGKYLTVLPSGISYRLSIYKEGYFAYLQQIDVPKHSGYEEIRNDISLIPLKTGSKIGNNVFFETGKAELTSESKLELNRAAVLLKANSSMVIEVGGHTDNIGADAFNLKLSRERAQAVRQYLINSGIPGSNVIAKGYGETKPVADNTTEEGRAANRRTEFVILDF